MKRRWMIVGLVGLVAATMAVYAQVSRDFAGEFLNTAAGRALIQSYGALKSGYLHEVDDESLIRGAITGMIESLEDPYTTYIEPRAAARENQDITGSFEGIGAVLTPHNRTTGEGVEILTVYQGGPASGAGLQRGDVFLEVDGVDVRDFTTSEVADVVRGPAGTTVELTMTRPGAEEPVVFRIERDTIEIIDVSSTMLPEGVGYLSLTSFGNQRLHEQMVEHLDSLIEQGATSLILDLRDNSGGLLTQAILISDEFLSEGDIVFQRARGVTQRLASADPAAYELPMVVLVNEHSASASEIVAGALQENERALIVGEPTFGKGVAQSVMSLSDGGQLRYVSFEWLTPDRRSIAEEGIAPDVKAQDTRFPNTISAEGRGLDAGQTVEILVDGVSIGSVKADEEGVFELLALGPQRELSPVQGEAIVHLESDSALQTAFDTVLQQAQAQAAAD
ncbi:MAG TPA: S41 family peptidase [Trueperaceae bacterium]|nr:S41 family peptidase [Trueperaceae bacterium]